MSKLKVQLTKVVIELQKLLAQVGYISEFIVHGIGPMPVYKRELYKYSIQMHKQLLL